jgi:hypothetical protein
MSLFPNEDIITKEIESWKGFADSSNSKEYKELFNKVINDCYKYSTAINTKIMLAPLLLSQHKLIEWLTDQTKLPQK